MVRVEETETSTSEKSQDKRPKSNKETSNPLIRPIMLNPSKILRAILRGEYRSRRGRRGRERTRRYPLPGSKTTDQL